LKNNGKSKFARGERVKYEKEQKLKKEEAEASKLAAMDVDTGDGFTGLGFLKKKKEDGSGSAAMDVDSGTGSMDIDSSDVPESKKEKGTKQKSLKNFGVEYEKGKGSKSKGTGKGASSTLLSTRRTRLMSVAHRQSSKRFFRFRQRLTSSSQTLQEESIFEILYHCLYETQVQNVPALRLLRRRSLRLLD